MPGTGAVHRRFPGMSASRPRNPIDRLSAADSMIALLGRLNTDRFPPEERMAVATTQVEAIDEWLAAYLEIKESACRQRFRRAA